ncbi:MAG: hypothetical protein HPY50_07385 [Firmicutes bacterium]|nr:hypothetical protein [Bacillota bacterium]
MAATLSKVRIVASLVVCLIDDYTGEACKRGKFSLTLEDKVVRRPVPKPEGYYVFTDLPGGSCRLSIRSDIFFEETLDVNLDAIDDPEGVLYVSLRPRSFYPFPEGAALIRGGLRDEEGRPAGGVRVRAVMLSENSARARVSRDGCGAGEREIGVANASGIISVNDIFLLKEKSGEEAEYIQVAGAVKEEGRYRLAEPLKSECGAKTLLLPVVDTRTDERGELAVYFRGLKQEGCRVRLEFKGTDRVWGKETEVSEANTTNLGVFSW